LHNAKEFGGQGPSQASETNLPYTSLERPVHDPQAIERYTKRPLPSLPTSQSTKSASTKVSLTNNYTPSRAESIETALDLVPEGTSPLEGYMQDTQAHELLAIGLDRDSRFEYYHRAGDSRDGGSRALKPKTIRRRGGHSRKRPGENSRE